MKSVDVQCGYLPLVDSAPLIIAKELKFAAEEGLNLTLLRQPSWSALRDMLATGQIDFAHMLSPMPVAMSLGLGGMPASIDALMVLSVNGTVVGVSKELNSEMRASGWVNRFDDPRATAAALFSARRRPIRIGVPFPFSMHRMLLDYWLTTDNEFRSDRVEILTVPPPHMADAVESGVLDMFCVGEPWGSVAVQRGDAVLVLPGSSIWKFAPEKVLGARRDWVQHNTSVCHAMMRATFKACEWLDRAENAPLAVEILSRSQHLDLPDHAVDPALSGRIVIEPDSAPLNSNRLLAFNANAANFPWRSQANWIADRLAGWHNLEKETARKIARTCFRSDLYRDALSPIGIEMPGASEKVEGAMSAATTVASTKGHMILGPDNFFNGVTFDFASPVLVKK